MTIIRRVAVLATGAVLVGLVTGCGGAAGSSVPSLSGATTTAASSAGRAQALHAAAQCIRQHGIPSYQDPVVAPDGSVYTDQRSVQDAAGDDRAYLDRLRSACQAQFQAADFNPADEPRATPELVAAGVAAARCMRAHGLPNMQDPTASTTFTPGHGFGLTASEVPPGGKTNPVFQQAGDACRAEIDAEINASSLSSLSHG